MGLKVIRVEEESMQEKQGKFYKVTIKICGRDYTFIADA